jgi:hypothetical protein
MSPGSGPAPPPRMGERHTAHTSVLRRSEVVSLARLLQRLNDLQPSPEELDTVRTQAGQFAEAQAPISRQEHHWRVPFADSIGDGVHLLRAEEDRFFHRSFSWPFHSLAGVRGNEPVAHPSLQDLRKDPQALHHRRRAITAPGPRFPAPWPSPGRQRPVKRSQTLTTVASQGDGTPSWPPAWDPPPGPRSRRSIVYVILPIRIRPAKRRPERGVHRPSRGGSG